MRTGLVLSIRSLLSRRAAALLAILSIALSVALLLGIQVLRSSARASFTGTVSRTDLIVGARGGALQLLLYSVFRIGSASNNINASSWEHFRKLPSVAWTIPYSLGDSHRGYRVVATSQDFYVHYRFRGDRSIRFRQGRAPHQPLEAALGSEVAGALKYVLKQRIALAHGIGATGFANHDDKPFIVTGILEKTGTPIDRSVYITLEGMEAIHAGWDDGAPPLDGLSHGNGGASPALQPARITSFLLGAKSRAAVLRLQREVNQFEGEPLMGVIPGVALAELWSTIGYAEQALLLVTGFVFVAGILCMLVALYSTLSERRRELAVFRSLGMSRLQMAGMLVLEAQFCTLAGVITGGVIAFVATLALQPVTEREFGILLAFDIPARETALYLGVAVAAGTIAGLLPAWSVFRRSLNEGLTIRV
jgi:putative ABC transport system permease protein